jgi:hypothetical protein
MGELKDLGSSFEIDGVPVDATRVRPEPVLALSRTPDPVRNDDLPPIPMTLRDQIVNKVSAVIEKQLDKYIDKIVKELDKKLEELLK